MTSCCDSCSISRARSGSTSVGRGPDALPVVVGHDARPRAAPRRPGARCAARAPACAARRRARAAPAARSDRSSSGPRVDAQLGSWPPARRGTAATRCGHARHPTSARMRAARWAAFFAPALPIATDATGTPGGIWTTAYSASAPPSAPPSSGIADHRPRRQRGEHAGQVGGQPGRADEDAHARPPRPRRRRPASAIGLAVGADDARLPADPVLVEHVEAALQGGQVGAGAADDGDAGRAGGHSGRGHARSSSRIIPHRRALAP